jgi:hypothetical protein
MQEKKTPCGGAHIFYTRLETLFDPDIGRSGLSVLIQKMRFELPLGYTDKPWTDKPWTDKPWAQQTLDTTNPGHDKPWTDKPWAQQTLGTTNPGHNKPWTRQTMDTTNPVQCCYNVQSECRGALIGHHSNKCSRLGRLGR